jgi:hypothetical protein
MQVIAVLWIVSTVAGWFSLLTLVYICKHLTQSHYVVLLLSGLAQRFGLMQKFVVVRRPHGY